MKRSDTLKAANTKWLVSLAVFDVVVMLLFVAPDLIDASNLAILRAGVVTALPVVVLLSTGLLSHEAKARLVFWKTANPLPGSAAFTKLAPADARIDMVALAKNVGELPTIPREQNSKWFKLYKLVEDDTAVAHAHKLYLMYRDMAAMSLLLIPLVPAVLWHAGATRGSWWIAATFFAVQYLACAMCARNSGVRFVCNVLAIHSSKKVKAKPATAG
jgi:hypothetical protein